jgi:L-fuconolactonase
MKRIDAHQHFWRLSRGDYGWLAIKETADGLDPIRRDFMPEDLLDQLSQHGVEKTILIQATDTVAETNFLLNLASQHDWIAGVIGWVDMENPNSAIQLELWAQHPKFKGIRPMLQDIADVEWITRAPHDDVVHTMLRLGLHFEALVLPQHLEPLRRFVDRWPELSVVIDHAAKPKMAEGWNEEWTQVWHKGMYELSQIPNIHCKLSGLLTETGVGAHSQADSEKSTALIESAWASLLNWFGTDRIMWGSDWPVLQLAANYAKWISITEGLLKGFSQVEQTKIWHDNASRFYRLTR